MTKELPLPEGIPEGSKEVVRVLDTPDGRTIIILGMRDDVDPFLWGLTLVDIAHHLASSLEGRLYTEDGEINHVEILERIKQGFDAEWGYRTDEVKRFTQA